MFMYIHGGMLNKHTNLQMCFTLIKKNVTNEFLFSLDPRMNKGAMLIRLCYLSSSRI